MRRALWRARRYARARLAFARNAWRLDFSPLLPPWCRVHRDHSDIGQLRRRAARVAWKLRPAWPDRLMLMLVALSWPLFTAGRALAFVGTEGVAVARRTGISRSRQWLDAVRIANGLNHGPRTYYALRFYDRAIDPAQFIGAAEFNALLLCEIGTRGYGDIRTKLTLFDACTRAGIATAPVVVVFFPDQPPRWINTAGDLGRRDLFLKWDDGEGGEGSERWNFDHGEEHWSRRGTRLSHDQFLAHCARLATSRVLVVQPALHNHPELAPFGTTALHTLRVMTYRDEGTSPVLIRASVKFGRVGAEVDNVRAGGIACALDPDTGELGLARRAPASRGEYTHHPDTGRLIRGARLGVARGAVALALEAHQALNVPWSVGWDVAVTPDGPVIIEGNPAWAGSAAQSPFGEPLPRSFTTRLLARVGRGAAV